MTCLYFRSALSIFQVSAAKRLKEQKESTTLLRYESGQSLHANLGGVQPITV